MRVKMILPALTEATSPFFRPIKYSLFPPLGLATLAGFLDEDDDVSIWDEHVEKVHHICTARVCDCRPVSCPRGPCRHRRPARHVTPR